MNKWGYEASELRLRTTWYGADTRDLFLNVNRPIHAAESEPPRAATTTALSRYGVQTAIYRYSTKTAIYSLRNRGLVQVLPRSQ